VSWECAGGSRGTFATRIVIWGSGFWFGAVWGASGMGLLRLGEIVEAEEVEGTAEDVGEADTAGTAESDELAGFADSAGLAELAERMEMMNL
jgi:hypothetical protein